MDDFRLTIELVPSTSWGQNLRDLLTRQQWDVLRRMTYKHYRYRCAICQASDTTLSCHEVWEYDDTAHVQKLAGLVALCKWCHHCKHLGYAGILALDGELDYQQVVNHFLRVNDCSLDAFNAHRAQAFQTHKERSQYEWTLDIGKYARLAQSKQEQEQESSRALRPVLSVASVTVEAQAPAATPTTLYPVNDDMPPTCVEGQMWLYATSDHLWYPENTSRCGKWLVFLSDEAVDDYWQLIRLSLAMWRLGRTAKVSCGRLAPKNHVICVYTYDYEDEADVMRVRRELSNIGIRRKLVYKSDAQTRAGLYGKQWAYNESGKAPAHIKLDGYEPIYRV